MNSISHTKLAAIALVCTAAIAAPAAQAHTVDRAAYVPPPPSSIAASAGESYAKLRAPQPAVTADTGGGGFDWSAAGLGAAAAAGLGVALTAAGRGRRTSLRGTP